MSYIGKTPAVGNFVKLDAISTSSTNTYNLTVDSVAFVPESANHMLVSLNGVIQAPLSSFSVSGSTITFIPASGTLSSSDSIDFIMVYGNVLDIGIPSDATVTNAKTNFVSTSSSAGLQIKGDGTTDGTLQLNCSQNSHGIKLKSPPHSASASYTLTFPNDDGSSGEALTTNGSGVLSWASVGGANTPYFWGRNASIQAVSDNTATKLNATTERVDSDSKYASSRFTPTEAGNYFIFGGGYLNSEGNGNLEIAQIMIYKNGSAISGAFAEINFRSNPVNQGVFQISTIIDMDSDDYVELYGQIEASDGTGGVSAAGTFFGGYKLI